MSPGEPPAESIATSCDKRSHRPAKKRRALSPTSAQAQQVTTLFARPDQEIALPAADASANKKPFHAPPDIVSNVQGSSAGAGSGEFHVYKAARRREYARLRAMDAELAVEAESADFEAARREREARDEEKTRKNREKRDKKKNRAKQKSDVDGPALKGTTGASTSAGGCRVVARHVDMHKDEDEGETIDDHGAAAVPEAGLLIHDDD